MEGGVVNVVRGVRRDRGRPVIVDEVKASGARRTIELPEDLIGWLADHRRPHVADSIAAPAFGDARALLPLHPRRPSPECTSQLA